MSKVIKIAAVLFTITLLFGCASSKTSKDTAAGKEQAPSEAPSGTIHFEAWEFLAILQGGHGHGTLGYDGETYKFKATGLGYGGLGVEKISATGHVYHLNNIADFPGKYSLVRGGATAGEGFAGVYLRNDKDVSIELKIKAEGLALTVGVSGVTIELVDTK
jgi:hypothetical protein